MSTTTAYSIPIIADLTKEIDVAGDLAQGRYCAIIGPHLSGKSTLAKGIVKRLKDNDLYSRTLVTVSVDIRTISVIIKEPLYTFIAKQIATAVTTHGGKIDQNLDFGNIVSCATFKSFLSEILQANADILLLLILDHLEATPVFVMKSLLECFRSIYSERDVDGHHQFRQLLVLAVGRVDVHSITTDKTSPFRAHQVVQLDLPRDVVLQLLESRIGEIQRVFSDEAVLLVTQVTQGDPFALVSIIDLAVNTITMGSTAPLDLSATSEIIQTYEQSLFPTSDAVHNAILLLEFEPATLRLLQRFINGETVGSVGNPMQSALELSGSVRRQDAGGYVWRNRFYESAIKKYFSPINMESFWADFGNPDYMFGISREEISRSPKNRTRFLSAAISLIRFATSLNQASILLLRSLNFITNCNGITLYIINSQGSRVDHEISHTDLQLKPPINRRIESNHPDFKGISNAILGKVYFDKDTTGPVVYFPIVDTRGVRFGVVKVANYFRENSYWQQQPISLEVQRFLRQIATPMSRLREHERIGSQLWLYRTTTRFFMVVAAVLLLSAAIGNLFVGQPDISILFTLLNLVLITSVSFSGYVLIKGKFSTDSTALLVGIVAITVSLATVLLFDQLKLAFSSTLLLFGLITMQIVIGVLVRRNRIS